MPIRSAVLTLAMICTMALPLVAPTGAMTQTRAAPEFTRRTPRYFKDEHPWHKGLAYFAKRMNDDSNGRIPIDIFDGAILGSEAQTMPLVKGRIARTRRFRSVGRSPLCRGTRRLCPAVPCSIAGTTMESATRHMLPCLIALVIGPLLVAFVPGFSRSVPRLLLHMV